MVDGPKRTHLVSGATSGIGRAFYDYARGKGDAVIPIVRSPAGAHDLGADEFVVADFSRPREVDRALGAFHEPIDSFVNCAGIMQSKSLFDASVEDMEEIVNINLLSVMVAVSRLRKNLKPDATIVLYGSQSGFKGSFDDGYAITKDAVHALTRTASLKLAPRNRIVAIAPGIVAGTRMTQGRRSDDLGQVTRKVPMHRLGHPRELAEITYFVLSGSCASMTGCTIDVNGANYLR